MHPGPGPGYVLYDRGLGRQLQLVPTIQSFQNKGQITCSFLMACALLVFESTGSKICSGTSFVGVYSSALESQSEWMKLCYYVSPPILVILIVFSSSVQPELPPPVAALPYAEKCKAKSCMGLLGLYSHP